MRLRDWINPQPRQDSPDVLRDLCEKSELEFLKTSLDPPGTVVSPGGADDRGEPLQGNITLCMRISH